MWSWPDFWSALTGLGTLALALVTVGMIWEAQRQRREAERQHRDQFKPICLLAPYEGLDAWNWRSAVLETTAPTSENPAFGTVALRCALQNVGVGPAMKLRVSFRFLDMNGWTSEPWELSPLGAGETVGSPAAPIKVPFRIHDQFNATDFAMLMGKPWEILLEYEDVFGRPFHSVHPKTLFDPDPTTFTWAQTGVGEQPKSPF